MRGSRGEQAQIWVYHRPALRLESICERVAVGHITGGVAEENNNAAVEVLDYQILESAL
jgi:hypothetical protein